MQFNYENIVRCVVRNVMRLDESEYNGQARWYAVGDICGVSCPSTAIELCRHYGIDPYDVIGADEEAS